MSDDRKREYRIGANPGDVLEEGDRVCGNEVNITARVESGGIGISGFVLNPLKKLSLEYELTEEQTTKNIKEPVPVYRGHFMGLPHTG